MQMQVLTQKALENPENFSQHKERKSKTNSSPTDFCMGGHVPLPWGGLIGGIVGDLRQNQ